MRQCAGCTHAGAACQRRFPKHHATAPQDIDTHGQFPPPPPPSSDSSTLLDAPAASPPSGATLAPGTSNVYIFAGPTPEPVASNDTSPATNDTASATANTNGAKAAGNGSAKKNKALVGSSNSSGTDGGANSGSNSTYTAAGFVDVNGDGIPDQQPGEVGMPSAPLGVPQPQQPGGTAHYAPAPSDAGGPSGGPQRLPRPMFAP